MFTAMVMLSGGCWSFPCTSPHIAILNDLDDPHVWPSSFKVHSFSGGFHDNNRGHYITHPNNALS